MVGDSHAGTWRKQLDEVPLLLARLDSADEDTYVPTNRLLYCEHDGGEHCYGQPQRQYGMTVARGQWLSWVGDDDIYLPGAFEAIRNAIQSLSEPIPLLFRWISPWKMLYWHTPGFYGDAPGHIDAECIVAPNIPEKLGHWEHIYQGDFSFISETIKLHGGKVLFLPEIIAQAQPAEAEDWTKQAQMREKVAV